MSDHNEKRITDTREFIRHPTNIPFECTVEGKSRTDASELNNISDTGLAFHSDEKYEAGDVVQITFPTLENPDSIKGEVVWSHPAPDEEAGQYLVGIKFDSIEEYQHARTVEKICHIESYRMMQEHLQKRKISSREAAEEWIREFDSTFPE